MAHTKALTEIDPFLSSHHCEHHYIFVLETPYNIVVVAVLHERMDLMKQLARRLR